MALIDEYTSITGAAEIVGVTRGSIHNWVRRGLLPVHQVGPRRMVKIADLDRLIAPAAA